MGRFLSSAITAAFLYGVFHVYALVVTPVFAPIDVRARNKAARRDAGPASPQRNREAAERWLAGTWAAEAAAASEGFQVRDGETYFFARQVDDQTSSGEVRFTPFALIMRGDDDPDDAIPLTLLSDSARVQFSEKFSQTNPRLGRPVAGTLEGVVTIRGDNGLEIIGRDFHYSEEAIKVWSDHPVRFRHGSHSGSADRVELEMARNDGPPPETKPAIKGVRIIRLLRNVKMDLAGPTRLKDDSRDRKSSLADSLDGGHGPVHVECAGVFEFNMETSTAEFRDMVSVTRPTGPGQSDRLRRYDLLRLEFTPTDPTAEEVAASKSSPGEPASPPPDPTTGALLNRLVLKEMTAEGPSGELSSDAGDLKTTAANVKYKALDREITLADAKKVIATRTREQLLVPRIVLTLTPENQLQTVHCLGPGTITSYNSRPDGVVDRSRPAFTADWSHSLTRQPDDEFPDLDRIELHGDVRLRKPGEINLSGDVVKVWLDRQNSEVDRVARKEAPPTAEGSSSPRIRRLTAASHVHFSSPNLKGRDVNTLEVWFEEGELEPTPPAPLLEKPSLSRNTDSSRPGSSHPVSSLSEFSQPDSSHLDSSHLDSSHLDSSHLDSSHLDSSHLAASRPDFSRQGPSQQSPQQAASRQPPLQAPSRQQHSLVSWASVAEQPVNMPGAAARDKAPAPIGPGKRNRKSGAESAAPAAPPPNPFVISASYLLVKMLRDRNEKPELATVFAEGAVRIEQARPDVRRELVITGHQLLLNNYVGKDQHTVRITGQPASVMEGEQRLTGRDIHLNRPHNLAWVQSEGELTLPLSAGGAAAGNELLVVTWNEKMTFDGQTAKFHGNVVSRLNRDRISCAEMNVTLSRRVSFVNPSVPNSAKPELNTVRCIHTVDATSEEHRFGRMFARRHAEADELYINYRTGEITGRGPGVMSIWQRAADRQTTTESSRGTVVQANAAATAERLEWDFIRVKFESHMTGQVDFTTVGKKPEPVARTAGAPTGQERNLKLSKSQPRSSRRVDEPQVLDFHDDLDVVYGPVSKPGETIDPDDLPIHGGWLRCDKLQIERVVDRKSERDSIIARGIGNAWLQGLTRQGTFTAKADNISYVQGKEVFLLESEGNSNVQLWRESQNDVACQRAEYNPQTGDVRVLAVTSIGGS